MANLNVPKGSAIRGRRLIQCLFLILWVHQVPAQTEECESVFQLPVGFGDFEIIVDPEDPEEHLLLTANIGEGDETGNRILVVRLDGNSGKPLGRAARVASNYTGYNVLNGPEFIFHRSHGLGVLYSGPYGVHGVWRIGGEWDDFKYDESGFPFSGNPPALYATAVGLHPGNPLPSESRMIGQKSPDATVCDGRCYSLVGDHAFTPLGEAMEAFGLEVGKSRPHPTAEGYVIFAGCYWEAPQDCALFEVAIDGLGGLSPGSFMRLTGISDRFRSAYFFEGASHPSTGRLTVFSLERNSLEIFESERAHQMLESVALTTELPDHPVHARVVTSPRALLLHFFDPEGYDEGSYVLRYGTVPHVPERVSAKGSGAELVFLPRAGRPALFYKTKLHGMVRCWL